MKQGKINGPRAHKGYATLLSFRARKRLYQTLSGIEKFIFKTSPILIKIYAIELWSSNDNKTLF